MKNFAVIGSPISHSLSPRIHGAWIAAAGIAARYEAIDGARYGGDLARIFAAHKLAGANVTVPYKTAALAYATAPSEAARQIGAANTLLLRGGEIIAENTDVVGFLAPLAGCELAGVRALIIGAGGAARAVRYALRSRGAEVDLLARRADNELGAPTEIARSDYAIVINATSASLRGELPAPAALLRTLRPAVAYDLVYHAGAGVAQTPFLQHFAGVRAEYFLGGCGAGSADLADGADGADGGAAVSGAALPVASPTAQVTATRLIDGRKMLIEQAREAAKLFYGICPAPESDAQLD